MTSIKLFINATQSIGPLEVWPLKVTGVSSHAFALPPLTEKLIFSEHDDGDGPRVNTIEVHNPTQMDFIIPSGWIVGASLLQVRTFNNTEHVKAGESILADVSCVEKGRWSAGNNEVDGGRAPLTVIAAGWDFDIERGHWRVDRNSRQGRVWNQVARQEERSGTRATSSLQQIMREDSTQFTIQRHLQEAARNKIRLHEGQNGFLIGVNGEPLLMEIFADPSSLMGTLQETIRAVSFDIAHLDFEPMNDVVVRSFVEEASLGNLALLDHADWAQTFAGGSSRVDTHASKDRAGYLLHSISINRNHKILTGV